MNPFSNPRMQAYQLTTRLRRTVSRRVQSSPALYRAYARVKGPLEERDARRSRMWHERRARRGGIYPLDGDALCDALRQRLTARGLSPQPKTAGDLHLFLLYPGVLWEENWPRILGRFGQVTTFDWREYGFDEAAGDWLEHRDAMNAAALEHFREANKSAPIDVVFGTVSGLTMSPQTLSAMGAEGAVVLNLCFDDKGTFPGPIVGGRYRSPAALAQAVDLTLTTSPESVVKYAVHGGLAKFFPPAGDPELNRPRDVPCTFDVSFAGGRHCWRPFFIDEIRRAGISVHAVGPGFENPPLVGEDLIDLYCRSRVNLSFSAVGNSRNVRYLKIRDFEIPMCGGLLLTQRNPELELCFDVGREVLVFEDERECVRQIEWVLEHPEEAQVIRLAGRERALRDHTWEKRFSGVFELAGVLGSEMTTAAR